MGGFVPHLSAQTMIIPSASTSGDVFEQHLDLFENTSPYASAYGSNSPYESPAAEAAFYSVGCDYSNLYHESDFYALDHAAQTHTYDSASSVDQNNAIYSLGAASGESQDTYADPGLYDNSDGIGPSSEYAVASEAVYDRAQAEGGESHYDQARHYDLAAGKSSLYDASTLPENPYASIALEVNTASDL
jgi:hypothetical protein